MNEKHHILWSRLKKIQASLRELEQEIILMDEEHYVKVHGMDYINEVFGQEMTIEYDEIKD